MQQIWYVGGLRKIKYIERIIFIIYLNIFSLHIKSYSLDKLALCNFWAKFNPLKFPPQFCLAAFQNEQQEGKAVHKSL